MVYYYYYLFFVLVNIKCFFFHKHLKIVPTPNFWMVIKYQFKSRSFFFFKHLTLWLSNELRMLFHIDRTRLQKSSHDYKKSRFNWTLWSIIKVGKDTRRHQHTFISIQSDVYASSWAVSHSLQKTLINDRLYFTTSENKDNRWK